MSKSFAWTINGSNRWGWKYGPAFWHYNLTAASEFVWRECSNRLRFYGFRIGPWAVGIIRDERREDRP